MALLSFNEKTDANDNMIVFLSLTIVHVLANSADLVKCCSNTGSSLFAKVPI